jgi:hypothetical protein
MGGRTHGKDSETVLNEIIDIHRDKFVYDRFNYKNSKTKVTLGCRVHGYFEKYPNDVKKPNGGCPRCNNSWNKTNDEFTESLPGHLSALGVYVNAKTKIEFICSLHNCKFIATPNSVLSGNINCPECVANKSLQAKLNNSKSVIDPALKTDCENYRRAVWRYSNRTYKKHMSATKRDRHNHLDHILSIVEGFRNNVPPEIMGSVYNLRILDGHTNRSKSYRSGMSSADLIERYNNGI